MTVRAPVAVVLYEDAMRKKEFAPHRFVCACIGDQGRTELAVLNAALRPYPTNGVDALLQAVRRADKIATRGEHMIALVDGDRVRRHLGLSGDAPHSQIEGGFASEAPRGVRFRLFVLERNLETVLSAIESCFVAHRSIAQPASVARQKDIQKRDLAFRGASKRELRDERRCVLERVPSFGRFVQHLAELCNSLDGRSSAG